MSESIKPADCVILLVEDEKALREMIVSMLIGIGFDKGNIWTAIDVPSGINCINERAGRFNVLLTDINMPDDQLPKRTGAEVIARALQLNPTMGVIAMSGRMELNRTLLEQFEEQNRRLTRLEKPFSSAQLSAALGLEGVEIMIG